MGQVFGCTPANGVWVLPGTHKQRHVDIAAHVADAGSDRLPDAVPLVCAPGDVAIVNRQAIHGSFANTSESPRVTLNMGFHRRSSVIGAMSSGIHGGVAPIDEQRIAQRSKMIGWAIDARRQRYSDETAFSYKPLAGQQLMWDDAARAEVVDYNFLDLSI
jgi:ectoine hydroxylase-related dioxygenase (phytanoyl-CoA dioxygenase family)|tara:strand:- start:1679 stop:2158 length:480 start_codon:yes stop_codon:yes gene_type:complete